MEHRRFADAETHVFVNADVLVVVGFQVDGHIAAELVGHEAESALSARFGSDADVLDVTVAVGIVILLRDLFSKAYILACQPDGFDTRGREERQRKDGVEELKFRIAVLVAGTLDGGDGKEIVAHPGVFLRGVYLVTEERFNAAREPLFVREKQPVRFIIRENVREKPTHFPYFARFDLSHTLSCAPAGRQYARPLAARTARTIYRFRPTSNILA